MSLSESQLNSVISTMIDRGISVVEIHGNDSGYTTGDKLAARPRKTTSGSVMAPQPTDAQLAYAYVNGEFGLVYEDSEDLSYGWNTRAHMSTPITPGTVVSFRIPAYSIGVIVGITKTPMNDGYADIEFGVMQSSVIPLTSSGYCIVKMVGNGAVFVPASGWSGMSGGTEFQSDFFPDNPTGGDRHEIRAFHDRFEYWTEKSGSGDMTLRYSATTDYSPNWQLSAALFSGGDKVHSVAIVSDWTDAQLPAIKVFGSDAADISVGDIYIPSITAGGEDFIESTLAEISIPAVSVFGGDDVSVANVVIPMFTTYGSSETGDPPIDYTFATLEVPGIQTVGSAFDITYASADVDIPKVAVFGSDTDMTVGDIRLYPIAAAGYDTENPGRAEMIEFAYLVHGTFGFEAYYLVWSERLGVVGLIDPKAIERAILAANISATCTLSASEIMQAILASVMSASDVANLAGETLEVWALHTDAMGSTRYEGYNFNSFATIDGITYGANEDGVYRLDGDTDAGSAIQSRVDFGSLGFGTNSRKALPYVYVGMSSKGSTILKVDSDGTSYYYEVRDSTEMMKTHRFELGKGLRSAFYGVTLISEGQSFDLHNIEFLPIELTRRL